PTSSSGWASATSRVFTAHPPHRYRAGPPVPARRLPVPLIDFSIRQRHYPRFMELKLAVFCDQAHEGSDGRLDLVGIFDELAAPRCQAMQNRMTVALIVDRTSEVAGEQPFRTDFVDDENTRVLTIQGHTQVYVAADPRRPARTRLILPLERVVF